MEQEDLITNTEGRLSVGGGDRVELNLVGCSGRSSVEAGGIIQGGCVMPIRIRCSDKPLDRQEAIEYKEISTPLARNPEACYTEKKPKFRILCGLI